MRNGFRLLMILSLLATIGSFTIEAWQTVSGYGIRFNGVALQPKVAQELVGPPESDSGRDAAGGTTRICVLTILVCGAGLAVIRIIRGSGPNR